MYVRLSEGSHLLAGEKGEMCYLSIVTGTKIAWEPYTIEFTIERRRVPIGHFRQRVHGGGEVVSSCSLVELGCIERVVVQRPRGFLR